jgi:hypothetical protein
LQQARDHAQGRSAAKLGPEKIFVNDVSFAQYHVFRSESRILVDGGQAP